MSTKGKDSRLPRMEKIPRSPLPYNLWYQAVLSQRMDSLMTAIEEYQQAMLPVPEEWVSERDKLAVEIGRIVEFNKEAKYHVYH